MLKMVWLFHLLFLCLLGLTGAGQESIELLKLYYTTSEVLQAASHSRLPIAVSVSDEDLNEISSSVLMAESWLRTNVLAHYPSTKISTIVLGKALFCQKEQEQTLGLILSSLKNIHHSLTRWGLEKKIKVSPAFSSKCLNADFTLFRDDLTEKVFKPLLQFLHTTNSTYSINPPLKFFSLSDKNTLLVSSHLESIKKLGFSSVNKIIVLIQTPKQTKPLSRKLSDIESKIINPYPARRTRLPEISSIPSSLGYSIPAHAAITPQLSESHSTYPPPLSFPSASPPPFSCSSAAPPPFSFPSDSPPPFLFPSDSPPPFLFPSDSPPPMPFSMAPERPPTTLPATPPYGFSLPPCNPVNNIAAPAPEALGVVQRLWCVAKPSVPAETLQEALDYASGEGGADCEAIKPHGSCFYPDIVVAHALMLSIITGRRPREMEGLVALEELLCLSTLIQVFFTVGLFPAEDFNAKW